MEPQPDFFLGFSLPAIISLAGLLALLTASAFMSAFETAFFSISPQDWIKLENNKKANKKLFELHSQPELLLATTLISNTLINIAIIINGSYASNLLFNFSIYAPWKGFLALSAAIAFLLLLFAEILPRIYAAHDFTKYTLKTAAVFIFLQKGLKPFAALIVNSSSLINKKLLRYDRPALSMDEISHALKLTANDNEEDTEILEGIVNFSTTDVNKVMRPRVDMVDLDIESDFKMVLDVIIDSGYSRIPVYQDDKDSIKGILYIKDLLPHLDKDEQYDWQKHIRPAYFIPENKKIVDLLADFQKRRIHIAIVVDEFGGTSGMVTLEDILEEIVGDINDEYDNEDALFTKVSENTYIFEAKIMLNDFFRIKGIDELAFDDITSDIETLAGLILELKGEIPETNEHIVYKQFDFEILKADIRRIEKVKLTITPIID